MRRDKGKEGKGGRGERYDGVSVGWLSRITCRHHVRHAMTIVCRECFGLNKSR